MKSHSQGKLAEPSLLEEKTVVSKSIWTEDPLVAFTKFLEYSDADTKKIDFNSKDVPKPSLFTPSKEEKSAINKELKVHVNDGEFYPLTTALNSNTPCSKLTIRNLDSSMIKLNFDPGIMPGIVGIQSSLKKMTDTIQIAYRNIFPSEFASYQCGPIGYHEYIIDGKNWKKTAAIGFFMNSNRPPMKIVLENCEGIVGISGMNKEEINTILENRCDSKNLHLDIHRPSIRKLM